jgi:hypothetical protein
MGALRWVLVLGLATPAAAETAANPTPAPSVSPSPAASPAPATATARRPRKLALEPWVDPYGKVPLPGIDMPRFEERVDVPGKAMDTASLTARMAWFMGKDWEPLRGAVPRGGSAPALEETYPFRPRPAPAVDVQALLQWLAGKLKKEE